MEAGRWRDSRTALGHCTGPAGVAAAASAPGSALGTLPIPFGEVLEAQAEFVVVSEELWVVGDFRQENLCNF